MKKQIKDFLRFCVKNPLIWSLLKPITRLGAFIKYSRRSFEKSKTNTDSNLGNPMISLTVGNGPFKGMIYPELSSCGSALMPKLLGSYEKELHTCIQRLCKNEYQVIINIGCGEGYYAIGMGLLKPKAKILAYDINTQAQELCKRMAKINGIDNRITVKGGFNSKDLNEIDKNNNVLIICDCEGYEKSIFLDKNLEDFSNCDIIIESHDFIDIEISSYIKNLFKRTHSLTSIYSVDDIQKALTYEYKELNHLNLIEKKKFLSEGRPAIMEWIVCERSRDKANHLISEIQD